MQINKLFLYGVCGVFVIIPAAALAEIPQAATITKINISGSAEEKDEGSWYVEIKKGQVAYQENVYDGQRQAVVASIDYDLNFWNVGEEGGTSGMLWWKKDHGLATLTFTYNFAGPGKIIKEGDKFGQFQGYKFEDADSEPDANPMVYTFRFSGGPAGTFTEVDPYKSQAGPATGRVLNGGAVVFEFPRADHKDYPYLIDTGKFDFPWLISGNPFFGWPSEEASCVDSGARFSSISRVVEIFPDSNIDSIRSAKPNSVLCVDDHVLTGEESNAIITFADLSTIIMKAESEIVIAAPPKEKGRLEVLKGRLFMNIKKVLAGESIEVKTNLATVGIKGTAFSIETSDNATAIRMTEGVVDFTSATTGETIQVSAGERVAATPEGLGKKETIDAAAELSEWQTAFEQGNPAIYEEDPTPREPSDGAPASDEPGGSSKSKVLLGFGSAILVAIILGGWVISRKKAKV